MRRWHEDRCITRKHILVFLALHRHDVSASPSVPEALPLGRFRKIASGGNQGTAGVLVHASRFLREPSRQERVAALRFSEQLVELHGR